MANNNGDSSFFEPILTAVGVLVSLITSLSPIFSGTKVTSLFINVKLINPCSLAAFMFSLVLIWVANQYPYVNFSFEKLSFKTKRIINFLRRQPQPTPTYPDIFYFDNKHLYLLLLTINAIILYFFLNLINGPTYFGVTQGTLYIVFFSILSYIFGSLISITKTRFDYNEQIKNYPEKIQKLLENYGLLNNRPEIISCKDLNKDEVTFENLLGGGKIIQLQTRATPGQNLTVIISSDFAKLVRVVPNQPNNNAH